MRRAAASVVLALVMGAFWASNAAATNVSGHITSNTTWSVAGSPFVVTAALVVDPGVTLTVDPGVVVKFNFNQGIYLDPGSTLHAAGTAALPVLFTSSAATPAPGDWAAIEVDHASFDASYTTVEYGASSFLSNGGEITLYSASLLRLDHATIRKSTYDGVHGGVLTTDVHDSTFSENGAYGFRKTDPGDHTTVTPTTFHDNTFTGNTGQAAYLYSNDMPSIYANSGSGNGIDVLELDGRTSAYAATTELDWDNPITILLKGSAGLGSFFLRDNAQLHVKAGQVVKALSAGGILFGTGSKLVADGTASNRVVFTSLHDDSRGGDVDHSTTPAQRGEWLGLNSAGAGSMEFHYTDIAYAGAGFAQIECPVGCAISFDHTLVTKSNNAGVHHSGPAAFVAHDSSFTDNNLDGAQAGWNVDVVNSTFSNNGGYGFKNSGPFDHTTVTPTTFHDNTFTGNTGQAAYLYSNDMPSIFGNSGSGNGIDVLELDGRTSAYAAATELDWDNPITILLKASAGQGSFFLRDNAQLHVKAGQVVKAYSDGGILFGTGSKLVTEGTASNRVVFTSLHDDSRGGDVDHSPTPAQRGEWLGLNSAGAGSMEFHYTDIAYAGAGFAQIECPVGCAVSFDHSLVTKSNNAGVHHSGPAAFVAHDSSFTDNNLDGAQAGWNVDVVNSTFSNNGGYGFKNSGPFDRTTSTPTTFHDNTFTGNTGQAAYLYSNAMPSITGNTGSGNGTDVLELDGKTSSYAAATEVDWDNPITILLKDSALQGSFLLDDNAHLHVKAGQLVKAISSRGGILFRTGSKLVADGTPSNRVVFTSLHDDARGGDVDHSATPPAQGEWMGINSAGFGSIELHYTDVAYGGASGSSFDGDVTCLGCPISLDHALVTQSNGIGVNARGISSLSIHDSTISDNRGNGAEGAIDVDVVNSSFTSNGGYGFRSSDSNSRATPTTTVFHDNTFTGNTGQAAYLFSNAMPSITGNAGSGNRTDVLELDGGTAAYTTPTEVDWDNPLTILLKDQFGPGSFLLNDNAQLHVKAGQVVKAITERGGILFHQGSKLVAEGTATNRVVFTSLHDDSRGGDADHSSTPPQPGEWMGINSAGFGSIELHYTDVAYGGTSFDHGQVECPVSCSLILDHALLTRSNVDGAYGGGSFDVTDSQFTHNTRDGFEGEANTGPGEIRYSVASDNGVNGFMLGAGAIGRNLDAVGNATGLRGRFSSATIHSSIVRGNTTGVALDAFGALAIDHSLISGNTTQFSNMASVIGSNGNFATDPAFVDEAGRDLHLKVASAAIDTGRPPLTDADGSPLDMGAYPFGHPQVAIAVTGGTARPGTPFTVPIAVTGFGSGNLPLVVVVTGANTRSGTATTDAAGNASFTYTPTVGGTDVVTVAADGNGNGAIDGGEATGTAIVHADDQPPVPDVDPLPTLIGECAVTATPPTATDVVAGRVVGTTTDPLTYTSQGTFTIHWTYDDGSGNTSTQTQTVVVDDTTPPVPDVDPLPLVSGTAPVSVTAPTAHDNCGGGTITGTTTDATTYTTPGTYAVHWTYDDGRGNTSAQEQTVRVENRPPVADAGADQSANEGDTVTLDGSASHDPDGSALTFRWTQIAGPPVTLSSATAERPTFVPPDNATYSFQLVVDDGGLSSAADTVDIVVRNVVPAVTAAAAQRALEGTATNFALGSFTDPGADAPWTVEVRWGDGSVPATFTRSTTGALPAATHAYPDNGTYTATVTVTDKDGGAAQTTFDVSVANVPPTASAGGPYTGTPLAPVTFAGSASDPAGARDTLTYEWDFSYAAPFAADASGVDLVHPSFTYALPGTYTVALRVSDEDGGVSTISTATVTVTMPASTAGSITGNVFWSRGITTLTTLRSNGTIITGQFAFTGDGRVDTATAFTAFVLRARDAVVFGKFGTKTFRLDVHDAGDPGIGDTLRLQVSDGYDSGVVTEVSGNLTVHA